MNAHLGYATVVLSALLASCNHGTPASVADINAGVGHTVIVTKFEASARTAATLALASSSYCADPPGMTRDGVRDAWRDAWRAWQAAAPFTFGPLSEETRQRIEFFPDLHNLVEARVDTLLAKDEPPTEADIAAASAPAQGFPALEYLLFADHEVGANDCAALTAISGYLSQQLAQQTSAWPAYVDTQFANSGEGGLTRLVESITREVVGMRDDELGAPLGNNSGNVPQPDLASSPYAQDSIPAMLAELDTMQAIVNGADGGPGLADRMRVLGAGTYADDVSALISQTAAALDRVTLPFGQAVTDTHSREQLYAVFDGPFRVLRNQVQSLGAAVGVTPGFNANDGD